MRISVRLFFLSLVAGLALALPLTAGAQSVEEAVSTFTHSQNMHPLGYSPRVVPLANATPGAGIFNSDIAFWGKTAYQGTYEGFRIIDVTEPDNPVEINNFTGCVQGTATGNQGDVLIWGNILVRSWNSPAPAGGRFCGNLFTPPARRACISSMSATRPTRWARRSCGRRAARTRRPVCRIWPTTGCSSTTAHPAVRSDAGASTLSRYRWTIRRQPPTCASSRRVTRVRHSRTW